MRRPQCDHWTFKAEIVSLQLLRESFNRHQGADETDARGRTGGTVTNFCERLSLTQSDLARDVLKDPYIFDFLGLAEDAQERDIEHALTHHITRFLLELGAGFAFVGRQYRLEVGATSFSSTCCSIT
jgi:YhcG PDDEXK nuclease domain